MKGNRAAYVRLFVVSFLILFAEVMLIRWLGVELAVMRVFPNLILTIIFIGSSIGLATYKNPLASTPVLLIAEDCRMPPCDRVCSRRPYGGLPQPGPAARARVRVRTTA